MSSRNRGTKGKEERSSGSDRGSRGSSGSGRGSGLGRRVPADDLSGADLVAQKRAAAGDPNRVGPESFRRIKLLGRGDVGRVYLVQMKGTNDLYAMKVLSKRDMIRRNKVRRVLTEREILATARHPFIVPLYWCFQSKDRLYFVMEYCAGGEFFRSLQKRPNKQLPEEAAKFYCAEVLLSLEYLHMLGFIYRDLKPENILMHGSGHLMLSDFDLSKRAPTECEPFVIESGIFSKKPSDISTEPNIMSNSFVGTEEYIAPEVILGHGHSSSVDWWTLGILLYEMVSGKTPFRGKNRDETFNRVLRGKLSFPNGVNVSSQCKGLIKKLLERNHQKRLGAVKGASEVRSHPFFKSIHFALIRNLKPYIIPSVVHPLDTSNFRTLKDDMSEELDRDTSSIQDEFDRRNPFYKFTFDGQLVDVSIRRTDFAKEKRAAAIDAATPSSNGTSTPGDVLVISGPGYGSGYGTGWYSEQGEGSGSGGNGNEVGSGGGSGSGVGSGQDEAKGKGKGKGKGKDEGETTTAKTKPNTKTATTSNLASPTSGPNTPEDDFSSSESSSEEDRPIQSQPPPARTHDKRRDGGRGRARGRRR